jgi:hypothetical protein
MFENLRHKSGYLLSRYRFPDARKLISFSHALSASRSMMLILPFESSELKPISAFITLVKRMFNDEHIVIVATDHAVEVMRVLPRSRILLCRPEDVNMFFLPRKEFRKQIVARTPDVTIDLNLDFLLPSAYICRASGSQFRIGFEREHSELFYNFQVRPDRTLSRKMIYDRLANCLQRF